MDQNKHLASDKSLLADHNLSNLAISSYEQQQQYHHQQQHGQSQNHANNGSFVGARFNGAQDILDEFMRPGVDLTASTVLLLSLYVPVFLLALLGNLLMLATLLRHRAALGKVRDLYVLNLALADLFVTLVCMPATFGTLLHKFWLYGAFLCKFTRYLQGVAVASSIFTLTAMSIGRYITIQHPVATLTGMTTRQAVIIILLTWLVAAILMGPLLYVTRLDQVSFPDLMPDLPPVTYCIETWPQKQDRHYFGLVVLVVIFLLPSLTLAVCYAHVGRTLCHSDNYRQSSDSSSITRMNSRKRAARMLIALVVVFMVFWLPYNISTLCIDMHGPHYTLTSRGLGLTAAHKASNISDASLSDLTTEGAWTAASPLPTSSSLSSSPASSSSLTPALLIVPTTSCSALLSSLTSWNFFLWLGHAHSAVNPLLYWIMNKHFRHSVGCMLRSLRRGGSGRRPSQGKARYHVAVHRCNRQQRYV